MNRINNLGNYAIKGKSPLKGKKQSSNFIEKRSKSLRGHICSEETRNKISLANKGKISKNKGKKTNRVTKGFTGRKHSSETIKKMSKARKDRKFTEQHISHMGHKKDQHWNWKGGITPENIQIRKSERYKEWRLKVFTRDNFTCIWCGLKENLEADHIKQFAYYPELRFVVSNGRTLCHDCHSKTETYLKRLSI